MDRTSTAELQKWEGRTVVDRHGDKVGTVEDLYYDRDTHEPEWLLVRTGFFGMRESIVPVIGARSLGDEVQVGFDKDMIKDAPNVDPDGDLSIQEEEELYRHYGLSFSTAESNSVLARSPGAEDAVPAHERVMMAEGQEARVESDFREARAESDFDEPGSSDLEQGAAVFEEAGVVHYERERGSLVLGLGEALSGTSGGKNVDYEGRRPSGGGSHILGLAQAMGWDTGESIKVQNLKRPAELVRLRRVLLAESTEDGTILTDREVYIAETEEDTAETRKGEQP